MQSELSIHRPFFSRYKQITYCACLPLKQYHLSYIVDHCLRKLLPRETSTKKELYDTKGQDLHDITGNKTTEEVAHIEGRVLDDSGKENDFSSTLISEFKAFQGSGHIIHALKNSRSLSLPDSLPDFLLGFSINLHISSFRFSLEYFQSRFTSSLFGFSPTVGETISFSSTASELTLELSVESPRNSEVLKIKREQEMKELSKAILLATGRDFWSDLQEKYDQHKSQRS